MQVQPQSALHRLHVQAGGQLQPCSGWQLPASYTEPSMEWAKVHAGPGISDASYLTKLDLRGAATEFTLAPPARVWTLTPAHALITSPMPVPFAPSASVTDVTSVYTAILLAGPGSREILQKLTTLNVSATVFHDSASRQTRLAHVNATVLHYDCAGIPGFLILITRDVAEYVWETLRHAGDPHLFGFLAQQQWIAGAV